MKIKKFMLLALVLVLLFPAAISYAGVPQLINYQGKLTDKNGAPVSDSSYNAEFRVYDSPTGGTMLWSETTLVNTSKGIFNVILGDVNPFPATFFYDNPIIYLAVKISTDNEMSPRQRITSVGFALSAADKPVTTSTTTTAGGGNVPTGVIVMWSGATNSIPAGWALCDGTNGTPDLRDRFVVGAGNSYGVWATGGEAAHAIQIYEMPSHTHSQDPHNHNQDPHSHILDGSGGTDNANSSTYVRTDNQGGHHPPTSSAVATNQPATATNHYTGGPGNPQYEGPGQAFNILPPYYALAFIMKL